MKIVINKCHGGFGISEQAVLRYFELKGEKVWVRQDPSWKWSKQYSLVPFEERLDKDFDATTFSPPDWHDMTLDQRRNWNETYRNQTFSERDIARDDPFLVQVVEELGKLADGSHSELKVVTIPDDVEWQIDEYDGSEWVAEKHRTWS